MFASISGLVGLGTFLDFLAGTQFGKNWSKYLNLLSVRLVRCFSLSTNLKLLFDVKNRNDKPKTKSTITNGTNGSMHIDVGEDHNSKRIRLDILDGIRVFAILWIIVAHCSSFTQVPYLMKVSPLAHYPEDISRSKSANWLVSSYLMSTFYPVSIFFMIRFVLLIAFVYSLTFIHSFLIVEF